MKIEMKKEIVPVTVPVGSLPLGSTFYNPNTPSRILMRISDKGCIGREFRDREGVIMICFKDNETTWSNYDYPVIQKQFKIVEE